jgi:hypothetical protein
MDRSEVYPDVLGEALSFSSQRVAQLGSLVTAGATVQAQRRARATAARAARDERAPSALRDQERAAWQLARAGWAPAHDSRWLAQAGLLQAARVWSAAAAYAEADPAAGSAARKCEERLRVLHPYALAWYDRLRGDGAGAFEAMRQALRAMAVTDSPRACRAWATAKASSLAAGVAAAPSLGLGGARLVESARRRRRDLYIQIPSP